MSDWSFDVDEEDHRRIAERNERIHATYGPGHVVMRRCPLCGFLEFAMGYQNDPKGVEIIDMGVSNCSRCLEIRQRNPEIYIWICGVVQYLHEQRVMRESTPTVPPTDAVISSAARDALLIGQDERAIKMIKEELNLVEVPASTEARKAGCICLPVRQHLIENARVIPPQISMRCPLHGSQGTNE